MMEKKLDTILLDTLSVEHLEKIKIEAELNLEEISKSEEIITNKSNSLFQILLVIFSTLLGYLINQITSFSYNSILVQISFIFCFFIAYSLCLLIKIIYPIKIKLKGASPVNLVQNFIFSSKYPEQSIINFLRNRVFSLDLAIKSNLESLNNRVDLFYKANKLILCGLSIVVIYSIVYFIIYFFRVPS